MPPTALIDALQAIGRRMKLYAIALGAGRVIAIAIGLLIAAVFIDWSAHATTLAPGGLPGAARLVLWLAAFSAFAWFLVRWVVRPALARYAATDVAGWVEERFPQFGDSLRSTINFIHTDSPGSAAMKQRVFDHAAQNMQAANLAAVINPRPVWYSSAGAIGAIALLIALSIAVGPAFRHVAASWLLNPLGGQAWPKSVQITLDKNVPQRVAVGDPVPVRMKLSRGDRPGLKAVIRYRYDNGPWQEEMMERGRDGIYTASLDSRLEQNKKLGTLEVQVRAGDDETFAHPISIVPRLDLSAVEADVRPPAYVNTSETARVNLSERPAVMAVGSEVALRLHFNKPLSPRMPVELLLTKPDAKLPAINWERPDADTAIARFAAEGSLRFSVHAIDTDHFRNTGANEYELIVREDEMPTVQIEEPRRSEERTAVSEFNLKAVAEDDYGILGGQLVVQRLGTAPATQPATPTGPDHWVIDLVKQGLAAGPNISWQTAGGTLERKRFELGYTWDLSKLDQANLKAGDVLEYFVRVKDNFNLAGRQHDWVSSGKLRITIISQEQLSTRAQQAFEAIHSQLKELHQGQIRNKTETEALKQLSDRKPAFDEADKAQAERIASQESMTASQAMQEAQKLQSVAQTLKENKASDPTLQQTAQSVQKQLQQAAEGAMKDAAKELSDAKDQKADPKSPAGQQAQERSAAMARAADQQQKAADQVRQAMDRLGNFDGLSEFRAKIEEIKNHQEKLDQQYTKASKEELGKKPEELSAEKKDELKKLADEQDNLSKQTQTALEQMQKKSEQMEKTDPNSSQAMKAAAQTGNDQQVPGKQSQSSQSMQQNQQAQAQQAQKQAEIGLEMIVAKLKEAERRKLEELQAKLAEIQQLVNDLVRRQAGHNIDNLILQGGDRLTKMDLGDRTSLFENASRDDKNPQDARSPKELNTSQRVTERNTRDVAKKAGELPDPAPAAKLTVAAGHMERAIVHLNNEKLPDAYDPPQVDALATLIEARKAIDEALKKVNDQLKQQTQDSIRQAYVKLLDDQKKIGKDIKDIDATPKDNGDLPRPVAIRLGQLPGDQGGLSDRAGKLGEALEKLDSIVYVWANKDIVSTMGLVKDDLAKPETGAPTQSEEVRIEEQLQAMIESLATKPKESDFNQKGGGGKGGGQKKARMPSEAELRLLKALQLAVNRSTNKIDAEPAKDKQKLLGLGGRQGELRDLLGKMIDKATHGELKLGPEPDNKDQLPEEASKEDIEEQEFQKQLLNDKLSDDEASNGVKLTGDRMARSRQRLALNNDPGKVTQEIQKRIAIDLDNLIELARAQQAQSKPGQGQPQPGQKGQQPKPGEGNKGQQQVANKGNPGKDHAEGGAQAAEQSTMTQGNTPQADLSQELKEKLEEWGRLHPRDREAVMEGASEKVSAKYQKLVEDYFKTLSEKAGEQR